MAGEKNYFREALSNKRMQWTANSAAQIAIGFANFTAICATPFAAIDAGVKGFYESADRYVRTR